jgi:acetolactate synthase I/II/III large subunit
MDAPDIEQLCQKAGSFATIPPGRFTRGTMPPVSQARLRSMKRADKQKRFQWRAFPRHDCDHPFASAHPMTIKLGTDYILDALVAEGLGHLFMVPGGLVDPFLSALTHQTKITPVIAAHEGGAVYMADGYARASGHFGAALGIGGPGSCNMATAVAAAKTDGSPLLVMTGEVPVDLEDRGAFQDASQATLNDTAVMAPLTRLSQTVATANNLNHWFRHALTAMWSQPRGPVHLSLAHDALAGECAAAYVQVAGFFAQAQSLSTEAAETALRLLADTNGARSRIAVLADTGVEHDAAAARLKEITERWSIPVATTLRAKGVFPEDHPLSLGVFGYAGTRHTTVAILGGELNCLLVLGSGFNERDTMHWTVRERSKAFMIHVNTDMEELTANGELGHVVPGSCHAFLDLMHKRAADIAPALTAGAAHRREWLAAIKATPRLYDLENLSRRTAPIHPAAAVAALRKALPRDGIVLVDSGAHRAFAGHYWTAYEPPHLHLRHQSRADGLGDPCSGGRAMRAARAARRRDHRRRLHADARHRGADRGALPAAHRLRDHQQFRARQCVAARSAIWRAPGRAHQHSRSRLGRVCPGAWCARLHRARSRATGDHVPTGAGRGHHRTRRCQGGQELSDPGV